MNKQYGYLVPIREDIEQKLYAGQSFSLDEFQEVILSETNCSEEEARSRAWSMTGYIKQQMAQRGIPFVRMIDGRYGVPKTSTDVSYAMSRYGNNVRKIINHAEILKTYAGVKNIMPKGFQQETIKIPAAFN